jgi:hypothetical protein
MDDRPGGVRVYGWEWGRGERQPGERRPGLPWIGIFLVVFGALLILDKVLPDRTLGNTFLLAAGIASLVGWAIRRRSTFLLYAGAFLTAAAIPGTLRGLGYAVGSGWGTIAFGVAFLFVALVGSARGGGIGWQLVLGLVLVAMGASEAAIPGFSAYVVPVLLVVVGVSLLVRPRG